MNSQYNPGIHKRSSSGVTNNNTAYADTRRGQPHLPSGPPGIAHGLSPPHEYLEWYQEPPQASPWHHQRHYNSTIPSTAECIHPPTPPMRDADYEALQRLLTQRLSELDPYQVGSSQNRTALTALPQDLRAQSYPDLTESDPRSSLQPPSFFNTGTHHAYQPSLHAHLYYSAHEAHPRSQQYAVQDATAQAQGHCSQQMPPSGISFHGPLGPTHGRPEVSPVLPAVQQWPTVQARSHSRTAPTTSDPFPGRDDRTALDKVAKRKMAKYTKTAASRRMSNSSQQDVSQGIATPNQGNKRKNLLRAHGAATPPPSLRRLSAQSEHVDYARHTQPGTYDYPNSQLGPLQPHFNDRSSQYIHDVFSPYTHDASSPYNTLPSAHAPTVAPSDQPYLLESTVVPAPGPVFSRPSPTRPTTGDMTSNAPISSPHSAPAHSPRERSGSPMMDPVDWDAMDLTIARSYNEFKYSVHHYEVTPNAGYSYAQSWLEDLLASNLQTGSHKWHAHTSPGFIANGSRLSVLVLHNACNPFKFADTADSTTTIGVYGIEHDAIHWKTVAPGLKWIFEYSAHPTVNTLTLKHKWSSEERKASEKRFHRAYYLAASRGNLAGMLNRSEAENQVERDAYIIPDEEYAHPHEFGERAVSNSWESSDGWELSMDEAQSAWERVMMEMEMEGEWAVRESVVTGCSEWE